MMSTWGEGDTSHGILPEKQISSILIDNHSYYNNTETITPFTGG